MRVLEFFLVLEKSIPVLALKSARPNPTATLRDGLEFLAESFFVGLHVLDVL
jgi:hypothetical protein